MSRRNWWLSGAMCLLAGCAGTDNPSSVGPDVSRVLESPAPTTGASASVPAAGPFWRSVDNLALEPNGLAEVIVTDLVLRSAPGIADDSTIVEGRLTDGDIVLVADGPEAAGGYDWYLVQGVIKEAFGRSGGPTGWVAASSRDGVAWIRAVEPICPQAPTTASQLLNVASALACYAGRSVSFRVDPGELSCGSGGPGYGISPGWLSDLTGCGFSNPGLNVTAMFQFPPGVDDPWMDTEHGPPTPPFQVSGHFDDPAAAGCTQSPDSLLPLSVDEVSVFCRTQFVVERIAVD